MVETMKEENEYFICAIARNSRSYKITKDDKKFLFCEMGMWGKIKKKMSGKVEFFKRKSTWDEIKQWKWCGFQFLF